MEPKDFRILGLAGSLRQASFHRGIVRAAHEVAPGSMSCEGFDLARIPYFDQDVEDRGNPEPVKELREKIRSCDAVLIATPEYDYAIPGVLTAALDWALRSRHDPTPFRHKPVGIVGASPGGGGTARGQLVLRQILLHPPAYVMPEPQLLIPFSRQKFDAQTGDLVDEETRERLGRFLSALAEWTGRFEDRRRVGETAMIRAFVFDLDGTLVETEELKALSYARAATELRPDLDEGEVVEAFKDLVGLSRQEVAVGLMRRFGLEDAARARMAQFGVGTPWQAYVQIRLRIYEKLLADPDLVLAQSYAHNIALLCDVRREGYPTALATQSHREQALRVLDILGLAGEFDVVVTRDDVEHGKPDPEMHLLAARELGVGPEECLAIEDSPAGVEAALAAGAEVVAVTTDLTRQKFRDADLLDRCHVVDDPRTLPAVVRRLIGARGRPPGG